MSEQRKHWEGEARQWLEAADREATQEHFEAASCFAAISRAYSGRLVANELQVIGNMLYRQVEGRIQ